MKQNTADHQNSVAVVPTKAEGENQAVKEKWRAEYERELMTKLNLRHPESGAPVTTVEELMALLETEAPAAAEPDPELAALRAQVQEYRDQEEERGLTGDAQLGEVYCRLRPEVQELTRFARNSGRKLGLKNAFYAVLLDHLGEVLQEAGVKREKLALEQMKANAQSTPEALGGESVEQKMDYKHMSDEEFGRVLQMALNGELRRN